MKNLSLVLLLFFTNFAVSADELETTSLLLQEKFIHSQPERFTKYTIETSDLKILIFKINYQEPPLNPLFFNVYFQCKSNRVFVKLNRIFNNSKEESHSYCGHGSFHAGTIQGEGDEEFLILPMKRDLSHTCPNHPNHIEIFPIEEMKKKCN